MVKLKSFRYIEPDERLRPESEQSEGEQIARQQTTASNDHPSAISISMPPTGFAGDRRSSGSNSLPSNEEYQSEQIELGEETIEENDEDEEEEEDAEAEDAEIANTLNNGIDIIGRQVKNNERQDSEVIKKLRRSLTSESGLVDALQKSQQRSNTPSLVHLRHQFLAELAQQTSKPNSPRSVRSVGKKIAPIGSFSPILGGKVAHANSGTPPPAAPTTIDGFSNVNWQGNHKSIDSISQHRPSLPMNVIGNANSCFEIKWRSIYLYAKQNKAFTIGDTFRKLVCLDPSPSQSMSSINGPAQSIPNSMRTPGYSTPQLKLRRSISTQSDQLLNAKGLPFSASSTPEPLEEFIQSPESYRPILHNVSGSVFSAQLTAVLGPSGVGKSSLLNTLTGRNELAGIGRVSLLGCSDKRLSVVFVPQWDVLPAQLTTLEDLQFTSRLKNPQMSNNGHERNINRVVKLLQLSNFLNVPIKKLSGGQARRLSIGRELLGSPDIMILDEPTSGLDANTCKKIIQALRDLTEQSDSLLDRPMSIIVTIHQPQQEVYELFHRVYVMAQGGRAIYEGPPGDLMDSFLENSALASIVSPDQLNENPAVVALEVASGEYGQAIIDDLARHHEYQHDNSPFGTPSLYLRSPKSIKHQLFNTNCSSIPSSPSLSIKANSPIIGNLAGYRTPKMTPRLSGKSSSAAINANQWDSKSIITTVSYASTYDAELPEPVAPKLKVDKRLRRSVVMKGDFIRQTWTLIRRSWLLATRDRFLMLIRILGFLGVAGGTIQIFSETINPNEHSCPQYVSQVDDLQSFMADTKTRLQDLKEFLQQNVSNQMFMFNMITTVLMLTAALAGLVYPIQLRMFLREYKNGWYSPASFITSITISELLVDIMGPVILVGITYQLCHQPDSQYHWREGAYIMLIILCALTMKSVSQIVAGFLRNSIEMAVFASCVTVIIPVLTSGLPVAIGNLPSWVKSISYLSFGRWTFEGLTIARYGYDLCPCDPAKISGYPTVLDEDTVPDRLNTLSRNLLSYYKSIETNNSTLINDTENITTTTTLSPIAANNNTDATDNLFSQIVRMATNAANPLIETHQDLGSCQTYRSLSLIQLDIKDRQLPQIFLILGLTFIILRIITYFCVKAVIKLSRSND